MARRISPSGGRRMSGGGFRASRTTRSFSGGFKPRTSYQRGGFNRHYRPYRRNYFFHSLGRTGKIVYLVFIIALIVIITLL